MMKKKVEDNSGIYYRKKGEDRLTFVSVTILNGQIRELDSSKKWMYQDIEKVQVNYDTDIHFLPYVCSAKSLILNMDYHQYYNDYSSKNSILQGISHYTGLLHLDANIYFIGKNISSEYQFCKCFEKSFPKLETLQLRLYNSSQIINNLFSRLNQNIKVLKIYISTIRSVMIKFELQQFSQFKNVDHFSLSINIPPTGFKHLANILKTARVFKLILDLTRNIFTDQQEQDMSQYLCPQIEQSTTLESLQLSLNSRSSSLKCIVDGIKKWPSSLKRLIVDEYKVHELEYQSYIQNSEIFTNSLSHILPELLVFQLNIRGFQYQPLNIYEQDINCYLVREQEECPFLTQFTTALLRCTQLQQLDLRFSGSLVASEKSFRSFFQAIAIKGLKMLTLDMERWKSANRSLTSEQDTHLVSFFLKNLHDNCADSLISLKFNFDGWDIFDYYEFITEDLVKFPHLNDLIILGPKNRLLKKHHPLIILEQQVKNKNKYIPILQKMKQISLNSKIRVEMLYDIITQFLQQFGMSFKFDQCSDPFSIEKYKANNSLDRDNFYLYKTINPLLY